MTNVIKKKEKKTSHRGAEAQGNSNHEQGKKKTTEKHGVLHGGHGE